MPDIKTDVLPWLPHGLFDNQNSHRKSKGEFMNVGNIFDVSIHTWCRMKKYQVRYVGTHNKDLIKGNQP